MMMMTLVIMPADRVMMIGLIGAMMSMLMAC